MSDYTNPYDLTEDIMVTLQDEVDHLMKESANPYDPVSCQEIEERLAWLLSGESQDE